MRSLDADSGEALPYAFVQATEAEVDAAARAAERAYPHYRQLSATRRAGFLEAIASRLDALGDDFVALVRRETALPAARIEGERTRTANQLRLFAEALENTPAQPAEALRLAGSGRLAAFAYGTLPGVWPQLVAYTLYRWENNIRMASVLGFVGAGGLGQMLYFSLSLFQQAQAATVILAMLVLVLGVDSLSAWARQRWVSQ
ncbi:PhnE/PtxC family ABC transporter permease [Pseudomonas aeruginosa]|uniref:PhnE/PtxC family ABC transporter permease n=1 Tax=Pseudomonas aeruginosa TaxID=287 RepID=UPI0035B5F678